MAYHLGKNLETSEYMERTLDANISDCDHSTASSLNTADMMYMRLPREIRDNIYHVLVPSGCVTIRNERKRMLWCDRGLAAECFGPPHYCTVNTLGPNIAKEMSEYLYESVQFILEDFSLEAFLALDLFGTGVLPARYVKLLRIRIVIRQNLIKRPFVSRYAEGNVSWTPLSPPQDVLNAFLTDTFNTFATRCNKNASLAIHLRSHMFDTPTPVVIDALRYLHPTWAILKRMGYTHISLWHVHNPEYVNFHQSNPTHSHWCFRFARRSTVLSQYLNKPVDEMEKLVREKFERLEIQGLKRDIP